MRAPAPAVLLGSEQLDPCDRSVLARFQAAGMADDFEHPSQDGECDPTLSSSRRLQLMRQRKLRNATNATKLDVHARGGMVTHSTKIGVLRTSSLPRSAAAAAASVGRQNNTTGFALGSGSYSVQTMQLMQAPSRSANGYFGASVSCGTSLQSSVAWRKRTMASSVAAAPTASSFAAAPPPTPAAAGDGHTPAAAAPPRPYTASFPARRLVRHPRPRPTSPKAGSHAALAPVPAGSVTNEPPCAPSDQTTTIEALAHAEATAQQGDELFLNYLRAKAAAAGGKALPTGGADTQ